MYNWNMNIINKLITYLKSIDSDISEIETDLDILYELKETDLNYFKNKILSLFNKNINLYIEESEYEDLTKYDDIFFKLKSKYGTEEMLNFSFDKIESSKEDMLLFTRDNLYKMNKKIGTVLEPFLFDKNYIKYKKNNENYAYSLLYLRKFYISLNKENNICDFFYPTHEFLHIYSTLLNDKSLEAIEAEFLSLLGEIITGYEMKKAHMYSSDVITYDMFNLYSSISYLKNADLKLKVLYENIIPKKKYKFLKDNYNITKKYYIEMYGVPLEYDYNTFISYFLALELFDIYKKDKEKCFYICENIIKSNDEFDKKLKDNNINLLENDDKYIKQLKKEYKIISNQ